VISDITLTSKPLEGQTRLKVLHVVDSLQIGGLERFVHDVAVARGPGLTSVACLEFVGAFGDALRKQGFNVELIGTKGGFFPTALRMWRHVRDVRPDIVHCHNLAASLYGSLAARLSGDIPVVVTKHGAFVPGHHLGTRLCRRLLQRGHIVGVSREAEEIMREWIEDVQGSITYLPNGIALGEYDRLPSQIEARRLLNLASDSYIIGIVARVTAIKGHLLLLDAFSRILKAIPNAKLLIVGDGIAFPAVQARVRELNILDSVLTMGERHDIPVILAALDVFCLPSEMEGMPITILEAMAASLPVVATTVGAVPDVVQDGVTGLLIPPKHGEALERALLKLAEEPGLRKAMGEAGRRRLLENFSLEAMTAAYERIYSQAVSKRS